MFDRRYLHICEVCGKEEYLTEVEAFDKGWDYPSQFGSYGAISPRTCGNCPINKTAWYALISGTPASKLTERQIETLRRIKGEPDNLIFEEDAQ